MPKVEGAPKGLNDVLEAVYSACMADNGTEESCSRKAWGAAKQRGWKKDSKGNWKREVKKAMENNEFKPNQIQICKYFDDEKQLVYGIVLKPNEPDYHGDVMTEDEIRWTAHNYMAYMNVGVDHSEYADAKVVESYLAPIDMVIGETKVPKGSWIVVMKVVSMDFWIKIKSGLYNAFSAGGYGERQTLQAEND